MNNVEAMFLEQMEQKKFHDVTNDDFSFVDSLLDKNDLNNTKEDDT